MSDPTRLEEIEQRYSDGTYQWSDCGGRDHDGDADVRYLLDLLASQEAAHAQLGEALDKYGDHLPGCDISKWDHAGVFHRPRPTCTCGLDQILTSLNDPKS